MFGGAAAAKAGGAAAAAAASSAGIVGGQLPVVHTRDPLEEANSIRKAFKIRVSCLLESAAVGGEGGTGRGPAC